MSNQNFLYTTFNSLKLFELTMIGLFHNFTDFGVSRPKSHIANQDCSRVDVGDVMSNLFKTKVTRPVM